MITLKTPAPQSITIKGQSLPTVTIATAPAASIRLATAAPRGPEGPQGPAGPAGPVGSVDIDVPDFTVIFRNALI